MTAESLAEERQKQTTAVLEAAAQSAGSDVDGVKLLQQQVPLGDSTASAYAFLATITKDCGAVDTSVKLLRLASEAKPGSHSYARTSCTATRCATPTPTPSPRPTPTSSATRRRRKRGASCADVAPDAAAATAAASAGGGGGSLPGAAASRRRPWRLVARGQ